MRHLIAREEHLHIVQSISVHLRCLAGISEQQSGFIASGVRQRSDVFKPNRRKTGDHFHAGRAGGGTPERRKTAAVENHRCFNSSGKHPIDVCRGQHQHQASPVYFSAPRGDRYLSIPTEYGAFSWALMRCSRALRTLHRTQGIFGSSGTEWGGETTQI
jgi:hypothetical protein